VEDLDSVYKLIGPVLVKQDLTEAKQNVQKRIDYINGEMYV
jgi:prefoldin beta subunit